MKQATLDIRQQIKWLGGLLAVWLLVWLYTRPEAATAPTSKQAYLSCDVPNTAADESHCVPQVHGNASVAIISQRAGFSFTSPLFILPGWTSEIYRQLIVFAAERPFHSYYSFGFLRSIFEHQITINAP
ncbi:hypothetical protein BN8_03466 [Fibrisoma limi BUZ 3]|uniref:Uncharacterized protein n=1 Tax=Fibrisoma limi BUZ 3 TaxID=1185876 RepID=I2GK83_9BACT|nr:hypothetical protein [Fibrisoma limi]CCH54308.1 hypothetical protein BN8_03466 [Fibrisoma limi BUZ 3]